MRSDLVVRSDLVAPLAMAAIVLAGCGSDGQADGSVTARDVPVRASASAASASAASVSAAAAGGWHGTASRADEPRPSFVLTDTAGRRFDFARDTAGRATLLFFGYTHCPDVCPTTMADLAAARAVLGRQAAAEVTVVFVTTDPARDIPAVLRHWLDQFDSSFVGLTGTPAQLAAAQRSVGVPVALADPPTTAGTLPGGTPGDYLVGHAAQVLGIGSDDRVHVRYFADTTVAEYVADLPRLAAASRQVP